jgi:dienelactone hydrolase
MLPSLLMAAAVALPASGTYTYELDAGTRALGTSTIVVDSSSLGVVTQESLVVAAVRATTTHRFDSALRLVHYEAQNAGGPRLTIEITATSATLSAAGNSAQVALDHPACLLMGDNTITAALMLPAIVRATGVDHCTFLTTNGQKIDATISSATPATHPSEVPAGDSALTLVIAGTTQTLWYDPQTLVLDRLVSAGAVIRRLVAGAPSALPTSTPFVSRFRSQDVKFTSKDGSVLAGTLSYPDAAAPFPCVILLQGSGVNDRNETVGPNPVFAELADALNARGYAVLRYDKRWGGASSSTIPVTKVVRGDAVADGVAAVTFAQSAPQIDAKRIYFLGHSEGGELVLGIALAGAPLRGVIMLAPLPMNYTAMIERQIVRAHVSAAGQSQLRAAEKTAYIASFNAVDPVQEVRQVRQPILLVHGSNDPNVTDDDLRPFIAAAKAAHPSTFTDVELAGDSHLFAQISSADAVAGVDLQTPETLDPRLIDTLATWLASHE